MSHPSASPCLRGAEGAAGASLCPSTHGQMLLRHCWVTPGLCGCFGAVSTGFTSCPGIARNAFGPGWKLTEDGLEGDPRAFVAISTSVLPYLSQLLLLSEN